jgi:ribonuclease Z
VDLSVVFYGTGGSVPTARRATACVLIRAGGRRILVDCGEGAQRQMMLSTGLVQVDDILITHLHADHYLGLPGLLKTYDLQDRRVPLRIVGPAGMRGLFESLRRVFGKIRYEVELSEIEPEGALEYPGDPFEMRAFEVEHRMPANGYAFVEEERPGRFDAGRARELGVTDVRDFGRLQGGQAVPGADGEVSPDDVLGAARPGRKLVITGDTAPSEMTRIASHEAQLLVHDGTFSDEEADRAAETGHSTVRQAAEIAADAGVKLLALVHISSRYHVGAVLDEAREAFPDAHAVRDFDLVEVPFPERGEPRLIEGGAREQPSEQAQPG